jgi:hypothetical protein
MEVNKLKSTIWKAIVLLYTKRLNSPTSIEQAQIDQLRKSFLSLPEANEAVSSEAGSFWNRNLNRLRMMAQTEDPRQFLRGI